jgi:hypothetical protein
MGYHGLLNKKEREESAPAALRSIMKQDQDETSKALVFIDLAEKRHK